MTNYVVFCQHTARDLNGVKTVNCAIDIVASSKNRATYSVQCRADKFLVEDFIVTKVNEYKCLHCRDTGMSIYDCTSCC